jgi:hypothetical protein
LTPQVFKAMKSILSRESAAVTLDSHAGGSVDDMDAVLEWLAAAASGSCGLIADCEGLRLALHTGRRVHQAI